MVDETSSDPPASRHVDLHEHERAAIARVHLLHSQLHSAMSLAAKSESPDLRAVDFLSASSPYMLRLARFYQQNLSLSRLLDTSDLLVHAEGPGAAASKPRLNAVNWICGTVERRVKGMVEALLPLAQKQSKIAIQQLDLRLTGIAPGSLYAGFCLETRNSATDQRPLDAQGDAEIIQWLRSSVHALPLVPQFVRNGRLDSEIVEALPDPALRDAAIVAAYEMSPTGKRDIDTISISSPVADSASARTPQPLGQRERGVLKHALQIAPVMRRAQRGSFVGLLRAIDLDSNRIVVRNISSEVPALRGVLRADVHAAKSMLDRMVRISGEYDTDVTGRPRLMRIDTIESAQREIE